MTATASQFAPDEAEALDAYSAVVTEVARRLIPSVAFVAVRGPGGRRPEGAGSAVGNQP